MEDAGRDGGSFAAVFGGHASAGNSCDDGSCSARGVRRFYNTTTSHKGDAALTACDTGFHMASLFELTNGDLEYDTTRGLINPAGDAAYSLAILRSTRGVVTVGVS